MKRFFSLTALYARGSLGRILAALAALCAVQTGIFWVQMEGVLQLADQTRELVILQPLHLINVWAFLYIVWKLLRQGASPVSEGTMARLPVSRGTSFLAQFLYDLAVLFLFWVTLTVMTYGLWAWYLSRLPEALVSHQGLFYWSYAWPTFHGLLPMADLLVWGRNLLWLVTLAVSLAAASRQLRLGRHPLGAYAMVIFLLFIGSHAGVGSTDRTIASIAAPALLLLVEIVGLAAFDKEEQEEVEHHA